ncbi:MAG: DUF6265 family protein [Burkholderiales bacterium]
MNALRPLVAAISIVLSAAAMAQAPVPDTVKLDTNAMQELAWVYGCWGGKVNGRDFREQWMPLRGNALLGLGSTEFEGKLQSYEFLRIEQRPDGIFYVAKPSDQAEAAFKLVSAVKDNREMHTTFTFENAQHDFPQRIIYRRGTEGWLYASIEGKLQGQDKTITYPYRRIDCESGEMIRN